MIARVYIFTEHRPGVDATPLEELGIQCLVQGHFSTVLCAAAFHCRKRRPFRNFSLEGISCSRERELAVTVLSPG